MNTITGQLVDVFSEEIYPARIFFSKKIKKIERLKKAPKRYILPGLIDAHIHTESSMLIPSSFARLAVRHGTTAVVADPHEIANVMGIPGINFMIRNSKKVPLKFYFGAPSCVPATRFESSGANLGPKEVEKLLSSKDIHLLSEVMNYPGVISRNPEVMAKIKSAKKHGKPVDGHAPGLRGKELDRYISAGIETDHECFMLEEAREKIRKGMKILVRQGSAAKNLPALYPLIDGKNTMLCSDDRHPDDLQNGHVNRILSECVSFGVDPMKAIISATKAPAQHYGLGCGLLREGDPADFAVFQDLKSFKSTETWIDGRKVASGGNVHFPKVREKPVNNFNAKHFVPSDFEGGQSGLVIGAVDGELITKKLKIRVKKPDLKKDILRIVVVNRYRKAKPAVGYIRGFGIKKGAFGSSIMHDSHNICVIGVDEGSICKVVNKIISMKGGMAAWDGRMHSLALPFAGLMSGAEGTMVAKRHHELASAVKRMGGRMHSPFMTLSFMALLVIPHLKMSDKGLFDADSFRLVEGF
jgi:adenine deaminase